MILGNDAVEILGRIERLVLFTTGERRQRRGDQLGELRPDLGQTTGVVRMPMIDDAGDVALHHGAAELFLSDLLADGRLDQVGTGQEDRSFAFDDVGLVAHDGQIGAAGDAGSHDRGHLKDPGRRQPGVVVEGPAKVLPVGKDLVLER